MRILIISAAFPPQPGGVATHVSDLAHALVHRGHDVFVQAASVDEHHATQGHGRLRIWKEGRECVWSFDGRRVFAERVFQRLLDRWPSIQPDVIHAHDFDSLYIAWVLKAVLGLPVVATIHRAPSPWRNQRYLENPKDLFLEALRREQSIDQLVVPSSTSAAVLREQGFGSACCASRIAVIPHGIRPFLRSEADVAHVVEELKLDRDVALVLCPGRADEHKDLDTFIEAACRLKEADGLPALAFLVCCDSGDPFYERVRELAFARNLQENQDIFFKKLQYKEMATVYRRARASVMTSRHEAFGLAVLEAFLFDVPVVAANTTALGEIITNGQNGLLYTDGDPDDLARQLARALGDTALRERLVKAGRAQLVDGGVYTVERMAASYEQLYVGLMGE